MKEIYSKTLQLVACFLFSVTCVCAQNGGKQAITGVVKGSNIPIPGVNIILKGTTSGTSSDSDGRFTISARTGDVLVFSFIGYKSQEVTVGNETSLDVTLYEDVATLGEVEIVAIGYGTAKRADLTGAISSISSEQISKSISTTFDQALQGRVPGVVITQTSGQPGGSVSVQIRGISTLGNDQEPLYVVDGVIIQPARRDSRAGIYLSNTPIGTNPLSSINPNEIESIDVLQDASAISIYGAQASNGVIVIRTKRGKSGAPRITFDGYYGVQQLPKRLDVMNLKEYATFDNDRAAITGATPRPEFANPGYLGTGTDWQDEIYRTVPMYNANLSMSGGDERTQYLLSGGYFSQEGIAQGSEFRRASFRLNLDNKTTKWLKVGTSLQFSSVRENINTTQYDIVNQVFRLTPEIAARNPDGSFGGPSNYTSGTYNPNPVAAAALNTNISSRRQLRSNVYGEIYIGKNLTLRNEVSTNLDYGFIDQYFPTFTIGTVVNTLNSASQNSTNSVDWTVRNYLTYDKLFNSKYNVNVMVGHEASENKWNYISAGRTNFPTNSVHAINAGDATTATNGGGKSHFAMESYFGRVNLGYNERYLLTANMRMDGSSNFADGNRWVTTYSGAFAWRLINEAFFENMKPLFSDLKLRLSYGLTNNQNIGGYKYGSSLSLNPTGIGTGASVSNIANKDVQWETTKSSNVGLDLGMFENRIVLTADAYYRKTNNLLLTLPLPYYAGTEGTGALQAPVYNVGSIENKGVGLSLNTVNIERGDFRWTSTITYSMNRNMVLELNTPDAYFTQTVDNATKTVTKTIANQPIGQFYGYIVEGMFNSAEDFEGAARPTSQDGNLLPISATNGVWVGDLKYKDLSGPGGTPDGKIDEHDMTYLGSPFPKFQFGITNTFSYKGFDVTVFFNGNYGNEIMNVTRMNHENPNASGIGLFKDSYNYAKIGLSDPDGSATDIDNVYVINAGTSIPGIKPSGDVNQNNRISSRFIEDGSYIRLKNLVVGYTLPSSVASKMKLRDVRVYMSGQNLFTATNYSGYDPEVGNYQSNAMLSGVDFGRYPSQRIYTIGVNVGL